MVVSHLIDVGGTLYGATQEGGRTACAGFGCQSVFKISPAGAETVLCAFQGAGAGAQPAAAVTAPGGLLCGTKSAEGTYDWGTVFAVEP